MTSLVRYDNGRSGMPALFDWDPLRLFDDLFSWHPFSPAATVRETDDAATVTIDMPGVDPQDVELTLERGTLTITGKRDGQLYRYIARLGTAIDPDRIEATLDKGVLTVRAPRRAEATPRKIAVARKLPEPGAKRRGRKWLPKLRWSGRNRT